ncbi:MAG: hypothetical protein M0C28_44340 [Candidatus Moduliflexus flocculans]|nr:hypothetical protein [Candidatus Moduliflexus flocculans]
MIAAFIIFIQASPIRLRIFPAAFAAALFLALEVAPGLVLPPPASVHQRSRWSTSILLPIYIILLFYLSVRTMNFIFDRIMSEVPGLTLDMLSNATETVARKSYVQYAAMSARRNASLSITAAWCANRTMRATTGRSCNITTSTPSTTGGWGRTASTTTRAIGRWRRSI